MTIRTIAHKRLVVGEKKQRFGFRKTILGLCGAILGSTLLMADATNNAHTVYAAESDPDQAKSVQIDDSADKEVAQTKAGADKGATGTGADKSGATGAGEGTQGTGTGADKGAQGDKSADVAGQVRTKPKSSYYSL